MALEPLQPLAISLRPDEDGNVVVSLQGEIDISSADQVWAALVEALTAWTGNVVVDFAEVSFLDSQGINTLLRVHKDCDFDAGRLSVRAPQPQARKVLEMTGLDTILRIED
jgi:anti-anti-sigma factor